MDGLQRLFVLRMAAMALGVSLTGCADRPVAKQESRTAETQGNSSAYPLRTASKALGTPVIVSRPVMDACVEQAAARRFDDGYEPRGYEESTYPNTGYSSGLRRLPQPSTYPVSSGRQQTSDDNQPPRRWEEPRPLPPVEPQQDGWRPKRQDPYSSGRDDRRGNDTYNDSYERRDNRYDGDRNSDPPRTAPPTRLPTPEYTLPPSTRNRPRLDDRYEQGPQRLPTDAPYDSYDREPALNGPRTNSRSYERNTAPRNYGDDMTRDRLPPIDPDYGTRLPPVDQRANRDSDQTPPVNYGSSILRQKRENENDVRPRVQANSISLTGPSNARGNDDVAPPARETKPFVPNLVKDRVDESIDAPPGPNRSIAAVASRSESLARHAMTLARRGAFFSARAEFIQSLRLIAQGLDADKGGQVHSQKLSAALKALEEADDFSPQGSRLEANLNVRAILATHRTSVLKGSDADSILPVSAMQTYYSYAQRQLAESCGHEPSASLALYGLGKLYSAMVDQPGQFGAMSGPKALAFHQAALLVDKSNYRAANELGVMLAKYGQLPAARAALKQSLVAYPMAETWHNLAVVHERLGEGGLAHQARQEQQLMVSAPARGNGAMNADGPVVWMSPTEFQKRTPQGTDGFAPPMAPTNAPPPTMPVSAPRMNAPQPQPAPTAWNMWGTNNAQR